MLTSNIYTRWSHQHTCQLVIISPCQSLLDYPPPHLHHTHHSPCQLLPHPRPKCKPHPQTVELGSSPPGVMISQSRTFEWFLIQACHPRSLIAGCHQCHHHDECDHSQAGLTTLGCFIFKSFINSSLFGGTQDESKSEQQAKQQSKIDY